MTKNSKIVILRDMGKAQPYVLLTESSENQISVIQLSESIGESSGNRVVALEIPSISASSWEEITKDTLATLQELGIRQATFIGFENAGTVVQSIALSDLKVTRKVILVNSSTSPHPTLFSRLIDKIESSLPLGLPLRTLTSGFDSRSLLQRIRCPVLIINTSDASEFVRLQGQVLVEMLPTAWLSEVESIKATSEICKLIEDFEGVRAKCPQKNHKLA